MSPHSTAARSAALLVAVVSIAAAASAAAITAAAGPRRAPAAAAAAVATALVGSSRQAAAAAAANGGGSRLAIPLYVTSRGDGPSLPRFDLPPGITPGGYTGAYAGTDIFYISDAVDGSVWAGRYSVGAASLTQLPATVGTGRRLYGLAFSTAIDMLWAAGGSLNGSGVGYALNGRTGALLATYTFAPGNADSFVSDVGAFGRPRVVFPTRGCPPSTRSGRLSPLTAARAALIRRLRPCPHRRQVGASPMLAMATPRLSTLSTSTLGRCTMPICRPVGSRSATFCGRPAALRAPRPL